MLKNEHLARCILAEQIFGTGLKSDIKSHEMTSFYNLTYAPLVSPSFLHTLATCSSIFFSTPRLPLEGTSSHWPGVWTQPHLTVLVDQGWDCGCRGCPNNTCSWCRWWCYTVIVVNVFLPSWNCGKYPNYLLHYVVCNVLQYGGIVQPTTRVPSQG